jgi:hypothetical protein
MLAQSFKSAEELGISEPQKDALIKTLVLLETGKLVHVPMDTVRADSRANSSPNKFFNMIISYGLADCGSVGCIRGTAERVSDVSFPIRDDTPLGLYNLFYSGLAIVSDPSTSQAATALRSYLTTGDAKWSEAVK